MSSVPTQLSSFKHTYKTWFICVWDRGGKEEGGREGKGNMRVREVFGFNMTCICYSLPLPLALVFSPFSISRKRYDAHCTPFSRDRIRRGILHYSNFKTYKSTQRPISLTFFWIPFILEIRSIEEGKGSLNKLHNTFVFEPMSIFTLFKGFYDIISWADEIYCNMNYQLRNGFRPHCICR